MAGMQGLVDASATCGEVNPLMKLTNHFTKDKAKLDHGIQKDILSGDLGKKNTIFISLLLMGM